MAFQQFKPANTLFHYCSSESFQKILASKKLRFTDLFSSNDPREYWHGYGMVTATIDDLVSIEKNFIASKNLSALKKNIIQFSNHSNLFCCCFSEVRDPLPMWRAYGGDHSGVSIGFRPRAIIDMPGRIQKVLYTDANYQRSLKAQFSQYAATNARSHNEDLVTSVGDVSEVASILIGMKHDSWSYEREVRIVYAQPMSPPSKTGMPVTSIWPSGEEMHWIEPQVVSGRSGDIAAQHFAFGKFKDHSFDHTQAVVEVLLGPNSKFHKEQAIELLESNGFSGFRVERSDCSVR
jgi:Protein of unknown function (DUF2971)